VRYKLKNFEKSALGEAKLAHSYEIYEEYLLIMITDL